MEHKKNKTVFFIEKVKHETSEDTLTVREILKDFAKVNPDEFTLALKIQGNFKEFENLEESIEMKDGMHFSLFDKKPTTAS
jgi:hypothetical protein